MVSIPGGQAMRTLLLLLIPAALAAPAVERPPVFAAASLVSHPEDLELLDDETTAVICSGIRSKDLDGLARLPNLQHLDLTGCENIVSRSLERISACKHLRTLILRGSRLKREGLEHLNQLPHLTCLHVYDADAFTDDMLEVIGFLGGIEDLTLAHHGTSEGAALTDAGLRHLTRLVHLTHLRLLNIATITDQGLDHLRRRPRLEELSLAGCGKGITNAGLQSVARLRELRRLDLSGLAEITDAGFEPFTRLRALEHLTLRSVPRLTDGALRRLQRLESLQRLDLTGCPGFTRAGVAALQEQLPACQVILVEE
jgi:hypothetical protein